MTSNSKKKTVAVVITWTINRDSRALRTVLSMSKYCNVDIFYIPIHENEKLNFSKIRKSLFSRQQLLANSKFLVL